MHIEGRVLRCLVSIQAEECCEIEAKKGYQHVDDLLNIITPVYARTLSRTATTAQRAAGRGIERSSGRPGELDRFVDSGGELLGVGASYSLDHRPRTEDHECGHCSYTILPGDSLLLVNVNLCESDSIRFGVFRREGLVSRSNGFAWPTPVRIEISHYDGRGTKRLAEFS